MSPMASRSSVSLRSRPRSRPVRIATRKPAAAASGAMVARCWRARISVGAIKAACRPGLVDGRGGEQRHDGLAGADVALQQAQHALRPREIGDDVVDRALLRGRERVGQGLDHAGAQPAFARAAASRLALAMGAQQRERELAGEQLVVGKPRPDRPFGRDVAWLCRLVQATKRVREGRKPRAREPLGVLPFGQRRQARERALHGLAHLAEVQPLGQRIDRLDQRQLGEPRLVNHAIGMHHLQHAVVERGGAGDVASLADRIELLQVVLRKIEVREDDVASVVARVDQIGRARTVRRGGPVAIDRHRHRDDAPGDDVAQLRPRAAIDRAGRQMEEKVDDARRLIATEQAGIELLELRTDARQRR